MHLDDDEDEVDDDGCPMPSRWSNCDLPLTVEVGLPEASRTGPSQVTSKKLSKSALNISD